MKTILDLFTGGTFNLAILGAGAIALVGFLGTLLFKIKKSGIDQQKAKEAEARERNLDAIKRAADARPVGGVQSDPRNRDNNP